MRSFIFSIVTVLLLFSQKGSAQTNLLLPEQTEISLLTCGSGTQLHSLFGHTALRIHNTVNGVDVVFNYGAFDFGTPNFYWKFVKGDLQYFVATGSYEEFVQQYQYENRSIYEQKLSLTLAQKQQLTANLIAVLSSDKKYYTYKFIDRNCTSMVEDLLNGVTEHKINTAVPDTQKDYRTILNSYLVNNFYEKLGINLIFGYKVDKQSDQLFLPSELMEGVAKTKNFGNPLAQETTTVFQQEATGSTASVWNNIYTFIAVMLLFAYFSNKKPVLIFYLLLMGLLGLFFALVGFYSFHEELLLNYNTLLINPLLLLVLFFQIRKNTKWLKISIYTCLTLIGCYTVFILNKAHLTIMLPIILTTSFILIRLLRKEVK